MLAVISPAKTLDFDSSLPPYEPSLPASLDASEELVAVLRKKSRRQLQELMGISENLAAVNFDRFREWRLPLSEDQARPALFAFKGDVYTGMTLDSYTGKDLQFAQKHLRILSGLYGILRPLDLILPYRLEMGTVLKTRLGNNLYEFWGDRLTKGINEALSDSGTRILVNLASKEYFAAVQPDAVAGRIVTPQFKEFKNGEYKIISFFAKKARGMMCDFLVKNRIETPDGLKSFDKEGYRFNDALSNSDNWLFTRGGPV